jgi:hypothetical protein
MSFVEKIIENVSTRLSFNQPFHFFKKIIGNILIVSYQIKAEVKVILLKKLMKKHV